jgi:membrane fusion protein, multidrug efflux system
VRKTDIDFWTEASILRAGFFIAPEYGMSAPSPLRKRLPLIVAGVVVLALIVGGGFWWHGKQTWEATDNAFVQADTVVISPQLDGRVVEVLVADNQTVREGDVLVRLDDSDARAAVAQAEANLAAALAGVDNVDARASQEQAVIQSRQADVSAAAAQARLAQAEVDRYGRLAEQGWVSDQRIQSQRATADTANAAVAQAQAGLEAERRTAAGLVSTRSQASAQIDQARAALDAARVNLERTVIRAPSDGVVGARQVRVGQYVRPGGQLMSLVPVQRTFIVANFKETQVERLRVGQRVEITADAFPHDPIIGRVESFSPATGSQFALIPIENASGNFTKITQRVPVRIVLEDGERSLRPGLSVEVRVDLRTARDGLSFADAGSITPATGAAGS